MLPFASPFTAHSEVCQKLSQTFGVDEAALSRFHSSGRQKRSD